MKNTKIFLVVIFALICVISGFVLSDAGFLGSPIQNPSPAIFTTEHPSIEMVSEDVLIELHSNFDKALENADNERRVYADITARFVFKNTGDKTVVSMYIPLALMTIFVSKIYLEPNEVRDMIDVYVDGNKVIVEPLYTGIYDSNFLKETGLSWKKFSKEIKAINKTEPKDGEFIHFRNYFFVSTDDISLETEPYYDALALSASWSVSFNKGETKIIECSYICDFTSDYSYNTFRFTYPLFTGASWKDSIGSGRIVVVPSNDFNWNDIKYYIGLYLPEPEVTENYCYQMMSKFDGDSENMKGILSKYDSRTFKDSIVFTFDNLEPVVSKLSWLSYYPDIEVSHESIPESMDEISGEHKEGDDVGSGAKEGFIGTMIYIYVSRDFMPDPYYIASPSGIPVYESPEGKGKLTMVDILSYGTGLDIIEDRGDWIKVSYIQPNGEKNEGVWIKRSAKDERGLILPIIIPYLDSSVE